MGEAELLVGFAAGEAGSVTELYRSFGRQVYALSYRVLGDAALAEEATRETVRQAWTLAPAVDPELGLGPWLAALAGRIAIDLRDRQDHVVAPVPGAAMPSTEQIQQVWSVRRALDELSDEDRELIRLHHRRLAPSEIADRLAIPLATVKYRSQRAHHRLDVLLRSSTVVPSPCG